MGQEDREMYNSNKASKEAYRDTVAVDETKVKVNPTFCTECYRYKELLV
jgi:hypothetical protein